MYVASRRPLAAAVAVALLLCAVPLSAQQRSPEESSFLLEEPAQEGGAPAAEDASPQGPLVSSWDFVRMLLILAAVVGVIYLLFFILKRGLRRQLPENELIRVLGSRTLTGNRALHLVELGGSIYLVGAAEGGVSLIAEVTDQETLDTLRLESAQTRRAPQSFAGFLQGLLKTGRRDSVLPGTVDFMKQQRERLQKM